MSSTSGSDRPPSGNFDGRNRGLEGISNRATTPEITIRNHVNNATASARPRPVSIQSTTDVPLRSAPLARARTADRSPPSSRRSHSANNSPTRLSIPATQEPRRSSDTSSQQFKPKKVSRHSATSNPLSRTSSLKKVVSGKKQSLSTMASLMQGQNLEALLRGKRKSRRGSASGGSSKQRSSSLPASPTLSRSESPTNNERAPDEVVFKQPSWSKGASTSNTKPPQLSPAMDTLTMEQTGPRRISFGALPSRQSDIVQDTTRREPQGRPATIQGEGRRISFAAPPVKPLSEEPPENNDQEEDGQEEASDVEDAGDDEAAERLRAGAATERSASARRTSPSPRRIRAIPRPTVTVTTPTGEKVAPKKVEVHPNTNYSAGLSMDEDSSSSESEEMGDIRRAQRLAINLSTIDNTIEHRAIRTIIRGDFTSLLVEAEQGQRRLRTYLVATDLSGEAAYALEWTIGTVLRDGDTLIAIFAVDEELGTGMVREADSPGLPVGEGGHAIRETQATMGKLTDSAKSTQKSQGSFLRKGSAVPLTRDPSKAEQERIHAVEEISQTCIKFLRKTKLQVRLGVEVVHCESPKHMITEAIDELEPTMVIVGSRGQSALKGVLLGSFSNYLVMKSSAPVMVARKKLRTADSKQKAAKVRLANNLSPTKRPLSEARID